MQEIKKPDPRQESGVIGEIVERKDINFHAQICKNAYEDLTWTDKHPEMIDKGIRAYQENVKSVLNLFAASLKYRKERNLIAPDKYEKEVNLLIEADISLKSLFSLAARQKTLNSFAWWVLTRIGLNMELIEFSQLFDQFFSEILIRDQIQEMKDKDFAGLQIYENKLKRSYPDDPEGVERYIRHFKELINSIKFVPDEK